jgi:nitric oxide reductase large subunit
MDFTRLIYSGRKPYNDKAGTVWAPGDTNLVAPDTAKRLLRFAEFALAATNAKADTAELQKAHALHEEQKRKAANEHQQTEAMLLTVESMDKGALEEYARKYDVELDKRLGVAKLRAQVANLIEQFGAR